MAFSYAARRAASAWRTVVRHGFYGAFAGNPARRQKHACVEDVSLPSSGSRFVGIPGRYAGKHCPSGSAPLQPPLLQILVFAPAVIAKDNKSLDGCPPS